MQEGLSQSLYPLHKLLFINSPKVVTYEVNLQQQAYQLQFHKFVSNYENSLLHSLVWSVHKFSASPQLIESIEGWLI
ncbi:hypothetical protein ACFMB7_25685 [Bacillus toyonensis]